MAGVVLGAGEAVEVAAGAAAGGLAGADLLAAGEGSEALAAGVLDAAVDGVDVLVTVDFLRLSVA